MSRTKRADDYESLYFQIYLDIIHGISRTEILINLKKGKYNNIKVTNNKTISNIFSKVKKMFDFDGNINKKELGDIMFSRYSDLYKTSLEQQEYSVAKQTLDSLSKLKGLFEPTEVKVETSVFTLDFSHKINNNKVNDSEGGE